MIGKESFLDSNIVVNSFFKALSLFNGKYCIGKWYFQLTDTFYCIDCANFEAVIFVAIAV